MIKPIWAAVGGFALLGTAGGIGVLIGTGGGEEEAVQQVHTASPSVFASATPTAAPSASASATPSPSTPGETPVPIPADWQTYDDPKGRFSIGIPPGWDYASFATENYPAWLQLGDVKGSFADGGAKLEIAVNAKQGTETLEEQAGQSEDPYGPRRLTFDHVTINDSQGVRGSWTGGFGDAEWATYVFERGSDWIRVSIYAGAPNKEEYFRTFDDSIIKTFKIR